MKNLRLNTQGNNALIERCEREQVKQMLNKNQGMIKLDQILPNYFTNYRVLTESADFSQQYQQILKQLISQCCKLKHPWQFQARSYAKQPNQYEAQ
ncbi:regulator of chromosome condensation (RCC1) protein (macronuclear) [Tetrahymena thermophila SB210]|uniref:Regulator of chromosome condensation (RCC1) protein n=1 Tax=Tetrahymena thermophila (strain SB210) TaxID=312017 RepID=W7X9H6_TETTS|nr:regulator of chromosome condensation (RCC1) protein [Tetrahymena thermophila SB210]EWS76065.1 regulator of chromosome condensation (RCC1) protein [Tetrahymena thermophila SB210]|eukprot:XP_012651401.1 regulator of chromosome condensation (RCC1) protein [Tetrahymena thermophila SB210]